MSWWAVLYANRPVLTTQIAVHGSLHFKAASDLLRAHLGQIKTLQLPFTWRGHWKRQLSVTFRTIFCDLNICSFSARSAQLSCQYWPQFSPPLYPLVEVAVTPPPPPQKKKKNKVKSNQITVTTLVDTSTTQLSTEPFKLGWNQVPQVLFLPTIPCAPAFLSCLLSVFFFPFFFFLLLLKLLNWVRSWFPTKIMALWTFAPRWPLKPKPTSKINTPAEYWVVNQSGRSRAFHSHQMESI